MGQTFSSDDLRLLSDIEEIEVETETLQEQSHRRTIWVVVVGSDVYVRSVNGKQAHWYQELVGKSACSIRTDDRRIPVKAVPISDTEIQTQVDVAYARKYSSYPDDVAWLVGPEVGPTTLKLEPIHP